MIHLPLQRACAKLHDSVANAAFDLDDVILVLVLLDAAIYARVQWRKNLPHWPGEAGRHCRPPLLLVRVSFPITAHIALGRAC